LESKLEHTHESVAALQTEVGTIGVREERALQAKAQLSSEKSMLERQNSDLQNQLQGVRVELDQFRETYA
jgi:FtsZ-binding cell division protein ZapB